MEGIEDNAGVDGSLEAYALQFSNLNVNRSGGRTSPHKPCMLLAVIDLAEGGDLEGDEVHYVPALLDRYAQYFDTVRGPNDRPNSYLPFFHLRSEPFWNLEPLEGHGPTLEAMSTAHSHRDIQDNVQYAVLDGELHRLLQQPQARQRLREVLAARWFPERTAEVHAVIRNRGPENEVERAIRSGERVDSASETTRDSAFRRVVLEAYDYRCAATGMRLFVPGVAALMDAAHLIPFAESRNDSPTNGMALTPTFHRALDRHLIAPGPDYRWHVSSVLDSRIADYQAFLAIRGQPVIFNGRERYRPWPEGLKWRLDHLLGTQ